MTWLDISDTHFVYRRERAPVQELVEENISLTSDSLLGRQYHAPVVSTTQTTAAAVTEDPISEFFNQDNLSVNAFQIDKRMVTCVVYNVVYFYIRHPMTVEGEIISHGTGQFIRIPCSSRKQALKRAAIIHCAQECMPGRPSESKTMQILNCILYAQGKTYDKEMTKAVFDLVDERIASGKKLRGFHDDYFTELCKDESQMKKIRV
jgi:hypothetical protein